jgi:hypothetical protein
LAGPVPELQLAQDDCGPGGDQTERGNVQDNFEG